MSVILFLQTKTKTDEPSISEAVVQEHLGVSLFSSSCLSLSLPLSPPL